jgi:ribonuclease D
MRASCTPTASRSATCSTRRIDDEALAYLADDVRHLEHLAARLEADVRERDIFDEVEEEARYMLGEAQVAPPAKTPFMRIKGAILLAPPVRARLHALAEAREAVAEQVDTPPTRLVVNELLIALATKSFASADDLEKALPTRARPYVVQFAEALLGAEGQSDAPEQDVRELTPRAPSQAELDRKKKRRTKLTEFRTREAEARGVDMQVVLPGHCLSDLVNLDTLDADALHGVPGFGACRVARYGARLARELGPGW